jgi:endoglucanase
MTGRLTCAFLFFLQVATFAQKSAEVPVIPYGINLCGGEFSEDRLPGVLGVDYAYPTTENIDYFYNRGFRLFDILFKWERIQKNLGGPLEIQDLQQIKNLVAYCESKGIQVILSLHNFGRYNLRGVDHIVGTNQVSRAHFKDVWNKLTQEFKGFKNIYAYDIMHEPHNMGSYSWRETAQQAIDEIRKQDKHTAIMIAGNNYAACEKWEEFSDDLRFLHDPSNKIIYDAHSYFDEDYSGRYKIPYQLTGVDEMIGVQRVLPFAKWLKKHNKRGFIGEYGVPDYDTRWLKVLENFMNCLQDLGINGNYWAGGPLWKNYPLSVQPESGKPDRPQMKIIQAQLSTPYSRFPRIEYTDLKKIQERFVKHQPRPTSYFAFLHPPKKINESKLSQTSTASKKNIPNNKSNEVKAQPAALPSNNNNNKSNSLLPGQSLIPITGGISLLPPRE